jgi:hypothetical protein
VRVAGPEEMIIALNDKDAACVCLCWSVAVFVCVGLCWSVAVFVRVGLCWSVAVFVCVGLCWSVAVLVCVGLWPYFFVLSTIRVTSSSARTVAGSYGW